MRWQELEEKVLNYKVQREAQFREQQRQQATQAEAARTNFSAKRKAAMEKAELETEQIFERFKVVEVLSAIKDDVWGEGSVRSTENNSQFVEPSYHQRLAQLSSGSFDIIEMSGSGRQLTIMTKGDRSVDMRVEAHSFHSKKPSELVIREFGFMDIVESPLEELIKNLGLAGGLKVGAILYRPESRLVPKKIISLEWKEAEDIFYNYLYERTNERIQGGTLPRQIRQRMTGLIRQIPFLEVQGEVTRPQLLDWEAKLTGIPRPWAGLRSYFA